MTSCRALPSLGCNACLAGMGRGQAALLCSCLCPGSAYAHSCVAQLHITLVIMFTGLTVLPCIRAPQPFHDHTLGGSGFWPLRSLPAMLPLSSHSARAACNKLTSHPSCTLNSP